MCFSKNPSALIRNKKYTFQWLLNSTKNPTLIIVFWRRILIFMDSGNDMGEFLKTLFQIT